MCTRPGGWFSVVLFLQLCASGCMVGRSESATPSGTVRWFEGEIDVAADGQSTVVDEFAVFNAAAEPSAQVAVRIAASDSHVLIEQPGPTDDSGHAMVRLRCSQAGTYTLRALIELAKGVWSPLLGLQTVTCSAQTPPPPSPQPAQLIITPDHTVGAADINSPTSMTLLVTDSSGQPAVNQTIVLSTARAGDVVVPSTAVTDAQGRVRVFLTAGSLGDAVVVAQVGGVMATATVQFVATAPDIAASSLSATAAFCVADGQDRLPFAVALKDSSGHGVPFVSVTFVSDTPGDVFTPRQAFTDQNGALSTVLTGTRAGDHAITAVLYTGAAAPVGGAQLRARAPLVPGPVSTAASSVTASPASLRIDGATPALITVLLKDAQGNVTPNQAASLTVSGSNNQLTLGSGATDGNGTLRAQLLSLRAEVKRVTVTTGTTSMSCDVTFEAGTPDGAQSMLTISPNAVVADNTSEAQLIAVFKDSYGNSINMGSVTWLGAGGNDTFTPQVSQLNAGAAVTTLKSTLAHQVVAKAQLGGVVLSGNVLFGPGAPAAGPSYFMVNPNTAVADGNSAIGLTVVVNDAFGNPVPGQAVQFNIAGGAAMIAAASGATSSTGLYSTTATSTLAGARNASATLGSVVLSQNCLFAPGAAVVANSSITGSSTAAADGNDAVAVAVTMLDAYLNPVPNVPIAVGTPAANVSVQPAYGLTDTHGHFTGALTSTVVQQVHYTVTAQGQNIALAANFTLGPPNPAASSFVASPNTGLASDGASAAVYTLTLRDSLSRALPGQRVLFTKPGFEGTLSARAGMTDVSGQSVVTLTSRLAGIRTAFATAGGAVLSAQASYATKSTYCSTYPLLGGRANAYPNGTANAAVQTLVADLNSDGNNDWLHLHGGSTPLLGVFKSNGGGYFDAVRQTALSGNPLYMAVTELNGDNQRDIVVAADGNYIQTFLGNGAFDYSVGTTFTLPGNIRGVCAADIDGDGRTDVVAVSGTSKPGFYVLLGDGYGSYTAPTFYSLTNAPEKCILGDFDGDGYVDVAVSNSSGSYTNIDVLSGTASHTFGAKKAYNVGINGAYIASGQLNGDGLPDIVSARPSIGDVFMLLSRVSNTMTIARLPYNSDNVSGLALADVNSDGKTDILVATAGGNLRTYMGTGNGNFASPIMHGLPNQTVSLAAADMDGDGKIDTVSMPYISNKTYIDYGTGGGNYSTRYSRALTNLDPNRVITADVDGDGRPDLIVAARNGKAPFMQINNGDGSFKDPTLLTNLPVPSLVAGDYNGDGYLDFAGPVSGTPNMVVYLGAANSNFAPIQFPFSRGSVATIESVSTGDVNQDGIDDIVESSGGFFYIVFGSAGVDTMAANVTLDVPAGETCYQSVLADFDNDGFLDLASRCNFLTVYKGQGNGRFGAPVAYPAYAMDANGGSLSEPELLTRDFNNDGYQDIAFVANGRMQVVLNDGAGQFVSTPCTNIRSGGNGRLAAGDFDGDGYSDLAWNPSFGAIVVGFNDGTGLMTNTRSFASIPSNALIAADLNGDGKTDLFALGFGGKLASHINSGCAPNQSP